MMEPYYQEDAVTIYHGDAREITPQLGPVDAVITDPVWPNNTIQEFSRIDPFSLLRDVACTWPGKIKRAVIHLGCCSDPRILCAIPPELPFLRVNWLRFRPSYRGRMLIGSDVAYAFGEAPSVRPGHVLIPGESRIPTGPGVAMMDWKMKEHPCPRIYQLVSYVVDIFTAPGETILDPFAGSGTTAMAAKNLGRKCILIEKNEKYCALAVRNISQEVLSL